MGDQCVVYPGSFDPFTYGHLDVIERGIEIFGKLTVAVVANPRKKRLFSIEERLSMLKESTVKYSDVIEYDSFDGLLVHYMKQRNSNVILRGLRAVTDFDYEFEMALTNRGLASNIETIFMMSSQEYIYLRASLVKEIALLGGDIRKYVPECVERRLREKINTKL
jgi:pantetheine-phosphate adenylyltransferase